MAGIQLRVETPALEAAIARLVDLERAADDPELLATAGAFAESAARRRITETKTAADGTPWVPWAESTRARRASQHSLLVFRGHLRDSIAYVVEATREQVAVGSNLVYAAHQHEGSRDQGRAGAIPARPFLGLSTSETGALERIIVAYFEEVVQ
ncbi:MAG: phage virion morphogenesis protein [Pseudomonadota bacterium]